MLDIVLIQVQLQLYETEENDVEIMVIRHWNDNQNEIPGCILQIEEGQQTGETRSDLL